MISIFSNDASPDTAQAIPVPAVKRPASSTAQHPALSKTVLAPTAPAPEKHGLFSWLSIGKAKKRLQMLETVSLGEKRFVALVQVDGRQFLIGGAPSNVGMLAELAPEETFHQVLRDATQGLNENPSAQPAASPAAVTASAAAAPVEAVAQPLASVAVNTTSPIAAVAAAISPIASETVVPAPLPVAVAPAALVAAPVQHTSVSPLPLAEAPLPVAVLASPLPMAAVPPPAPSLPPHVAARLADLQAAAATAPASSVFADDLSLEEPISLSPSLLAAMQQRARAALLADESVPTPTPAVQSVLQGEVPVAHSAIPAPAPSFTFQFSPMLTSTTQASRMSGAALKLQGATA